MQYGELTESLHVIAMTEPGETTCHSRADITAAGGAGVGKGELKREISPTLGAPRRGTASTLQLVRDGERETGAPDLAHARTRAGTAGLAIR